eukprot:144254-Chlamydomonas_euryale.AAC.5
MSVTELKPRQRHGWSNDHDLRLCTAFMNSPCFKATAPTMPTSATKSLGSSAGNATSSAYISTTIRDIRSVSNAPLDLIRLTVNERPTSPSERTTPFMSVCRSFSNVTTCRCTPYNDSTFYSASRLMPS